MRALVITAAALLAAATPALAGPPWIGIETPANPLDARSRGAFLLVHAYHHGTPMQFPVTGRAEGIVNGRRTTVELSFSETAWSGVYALRYEVAKEGVWILVISVSQGPNDAATAIVRVKDGEVVGVRVPMAGNGPKAVTASDVDQALRTYAAELASTGGSPAPYGLAAVGLLVVGMLRRRD